MNNKKSTVKEYAVSQYPRKLKAAEVKKLGYTDPKIMGYSLRTERYRYTVWMNNNFTSKEPYSESRVYASELYDYEKDPLEKTNVIDDAAYKKVNAHMNDLFLDFLKSQEATQ
jgi:hypothetical protein